jgi:hypothetical protein
MEYSEVGKIVASNPFCLLNDHDLYMKTLNYFKKEKEVLKNAKFDEVIEMNKNPPEIKVALRNEWIRRNKENTYYEIVKKVNY